MIEALIAVELGLTVALLVLAWQVHALVRGGPPDGPKEPGPDTSELTHLRHHHRFPTKDADGIRTCRCGDRYTDGLVV